MAQQRWRSVCILTSASLAILQNFIITYRDDPTGERHPVWAAQWISRLRHPCPSRPEHFRTQSGEMRCRWRHFTAGGPSNGALLHPQLKSTRECRCCRWRASSPGRGAPIQTKSPRRSFSYRALCVPIRPPPGAHSFHARCARQNRHRAVHRAGTGKARVGTVGHRHPAGLGCTQDVAKRRISDSASLLGTAV